LPEYVQKYATKEQAEQAESEDEDEMSSMESFSDEEAPGMEL
jgi:ubiquitin-conjugating enzyme E2 H